MVHHDMDFFGGLNDVVVVVLNVLIFSCNIWQIFRTEIKKMEVMGAVVLLLSGLQRSAAMYGSGWGRGRS